MAKNSSKSNAQVNRKIVFKNSSTQQSSFIDQNHILNDRNTMIQPPSTTATVPLTIVNNKQSSIVSEQRPSDQKSFEQVLNLNALSPKTSPELAKKTALFNNSSFSSSSQSGSSDNLKDAVRKWHAKRKKDNNCISFDSKKAQENETPTNVSNKKMEIKRSNIIVNNEVPFDLNSTPQYIAEQKKQRTNIDTETSKKGPFDGPLSFDAIMALKRKRVASNDEKLSDKTIKSNTGSSNRVLQDTAGTYDILRLDFKILEEINSIHSRSFDLINELGSCKTLSEVINKLIAIINYLSMSLEKIIADNNFFNKSDYLNLNKSLELCMNIISYNSNSTGEKVDDLALELLAKYRSIFESLKALCNMNALNDNSLQFTYKHINKYTQIVDQINKTLQEIY